MRKNALYVVLVGILLFSAGEWTVDTILNQPLSSLENDRDGYLRRIERSKKELTKARAAARQLMDYERRSLPSDPNVARSLYQAWLLQLVEHVGLKDRTVNSSPPQGRKGLFSVITCSVRAKGSLDQLTAFLYEFYSAGHLHQIRSISMTPIQRTGELDLSITVEAAALPGADRTDTLSQERGDRLASESLLAYAPFAQRNFFAVGGGFDPTDQTYLSAVNYVDGRPEAWFMLRGSDELRKLTLGDVLSIGQFTGMITEIDDADVVLESEGQRWLLTIGENLTDAYALPPEY